MGISAKGEAIYTEKLYPSINTILAVLMPVPIVWLATFPFHPVIGLWAASTAAVTALAVIWLNAPSIVLTAETFSVGSVKLSVAEIDDVSIVRAEEAQLERGPLRAPDAFVSLRGTSNKLVKIRLNSSIDPTPYWLIGSRNPELLAQRIASARL